MQSIFKFEDYSVRTDIAENGEPLFCASDVARCLGYANAKDAVIRHCKGVVKRDLLSIGGKQEANFIRESDVYRLVFKSHLSGAQKFMDWIAEEVLPSIRKTGSYSMMVPKSFPEALELAAKAIREKEEAEKQVKKLKPYAEVGRAFAEREGSARIGEFSKCIMIDGCVMGQNNMFKFLREIGFITKHTNEPYQCHVDAGRAYLLQGEHKEKNKKVTHFTPMLTIKGQCYIVTKLQDHPYFKDKSIVINSRVLNIMPANEYEEVGEYND